MPKSLLPIIKAPTSSIQPFETIHSPYKTLQQPYENPVLVFKAPIFKPSEALMDPIFQSYEALKSSHNPFLTDDRSPKRGLIKP